MLKQIFHSSILVDGVEIISREEIGRENNLDEAKTGLRGNNDDEKIDTGMENTTVTEGSGYIVFLHECAWCERCNMSRTVINDGTLLDDPFPVCHNGDCIYESQICDGAQNTTGWYPGTRDCIDGTDEEEWFCHGLQVEYANGILNGEGSGSGDYWEIDEEEEEDDEEDGRLKLKKFDSDSEEDISEEEDEIVPN